MQSFANSVGWNASGPMSTLRYAPFTCPDARHPWQQQADQPAAITYR